MRRDQLEALQAMDLNAWILRDDAYSQRSVTRLEMTPEISTKPEMTPAAGEVATVSLNDGSGPVALDWDDLAGKVARCTRCDLAEGRHVAVFGTGDHTARWMIIGEGPGAEEDQRGEPFVGRAGKLLDAMLAALQLRRDGVYIANIVKCRPPGNRDPSAVEIESCWPYLLRQIEWVDPALILALGRVAAQRLLGVDSALSRLRGKVHNALGGRKLVATYHPAYLLRRPEAKAAAWQDLKLALTTAAPRTVTSQP